MCFIYRIYLINSRANYLIRAPKDLNITPLNNTRILEGSANAIK